MADDSGLGSVMVNGTEMDVQSVDPVFGEQVDLYAPLNWEDSFAVASAQLGVSEAEWQAFINGVNDIKARSADFQASRAFQDMQTLRDRRVLNLLHNNPEMTEADAVAQVEGSDWYQGLLANQEGYGELTDELNALYESVGLEARGGVMGTGGTSSLTGAGLNFDLTTGSLTHHEGDLIHDLGKAGVMAAASFMVGGALTTALTPTLGAAGAKAASAAITNLAKQYVQGGDLSWEDALMSAALSYGGAELSEALQGSGVIGDIGSKISQFGDDVMNGGGDILTAALQAGGMSLVTQLVKDGEVDWKDAAIAAAMAGGTTALQGFLADIGKPDAEGEVLEEITVTAQHKGTKVGDGLYMLDDGTVISTNGDGNVLGNMSDLDLDGDGLLNANDLQEVDVNHDYVSTKPNSGEYLDYDSGENAFREGGTYYISEDGVVHQRGDVTYIDGGPNGTYLVKDAQGNTFYVKDATFAAEGRFIDEDGNYVAVNGYYNAADGKVYDNIEDYTSVNAITDNTADQITPTYGRNPNWTDDPDYKGTIYSAGGEQDIYHNLETGYYTKDADGNVAVVNVNDVPEEVRQEVIDSTSQDNSGSNGDGNKGLTGTPDDSLSAPPSLDSIGGPSADGGYTPDQLAQIAELAGTTVLDVINRLESGETVEQILTVDKGDTSITPNGSDSNQDKNTNTNPPVTDGNTTGSDNTTGNPNPTYDPEAYEERLAQIMGRTGKTREEAMRQMAHAVKLGADLDGDGIVYDAEWREFKGIDQNNGNNDSGNNNDGNGNQGGDSNTGGLNGGLNSGGDKNGDPVKPGGGPNKPGNGGNGDPGGGDGTGDGEGPGDGNGNGNGLGNGDGLMGLAASGGGSGRPVWGELFAQPKFRPHTPYQSKVTQSLFGDLMGTDWLRGRR